MNLTFTSLVFAFFVFVASVQTQHILPQSYDWRDIITFSPIGDQGNCSAFYAFTTSVLTEALHAINYPEQGPLTLSKQQLVDCTNQANDPNYYNQGCNGGSVSPAFQYLINHGVVEEKYYHYFGNVSQI